MSLKPVCVPCERFMRMKKSAFYFIEGMPTRAKTEIGKGSLDWKPYKLWMGDLWECPTCHHQAIHGTGLYPIAEHYQANFNEEIELLNADQLFVKDC